MATDEKYPQALLPGSVLAGQYIIDKVLGQGGFGITYRATDHRTGAKVAVKEFFPDTLAFREMTTVCSYPGERTENFQYGKENFLQEAKTLAQFIGNDNIVRIHSYFEENGTAYFVMDYIEGISFDQYLKQKGGRISVQEAERILIPIMDALAAVHSKGIVHRDVTPDNIYICNDGTVKLLDFGAARYSLGDKSRSLDVILKHGFAPKEQYTRRGKQGPYTDIYSLAATFYFAITGKRPPDSVDRLDEDDLVPPSSLGVQITDYQEKAIFQAMEVQPHSRFQSMEVFKRVLLNEAGGGAPAAAQAPGYSDSGRTVAAPVSGGFPPQQVSQPVYPGQQPVPGQFPGQQPPAGQIPYNPGAQAYPGQQGGGKNKGLIIGVIAAAAVLVIAVAIAIPVILSSRNNDSIATGGGGGGGEDASSKSESSALWGGGSDPSGSSSDPSGSSSDPSGSSSDPTPSYPLTSGDESSVVESSVVESSVEESSFVESSVDESSVDEDPSTENVLGADPKNIANDGIIGDGLDSIIFIDSDYHKMLLLGNESKKQYTIYDTQPGKFSNIIYDDSQLYFLYDGTAHHADVTSSYNSEIIPELKSYSGKIKKMYLTDSYYIIYSGGYVYSIDRESGKKVSSVSVPDEKCFTVTDGWIYFSQNTSGRSELKRASIDDFSKVASFYIYNTTGQFKRVITDGENIYTLFKVTGGSWSIYMFPMSLSVDTQKYWVLKTSDFASSGSEYGFTVEGDNAFLSFGNSKSKTLYCLKLSGGSKGGSYTKTALSSSGQNAVSPCIFKSSDGSYQVNYMAKNTSTGVVSNYLNRFDSSGKLIKNS